ncbi:hypothetical protein BYT27DRAFT_7183323 [Phlegmacium glaucopus]|nr:hypothetical protein BYT27DRAFT_7183323 [Phlegmacium glaucopus]
MISELIRIKRLGRYLRPIKSLPKDYAKLRLRASGQIFRRDWDHAQTNPLRLPRSKLANKESVPSSSDDLKISACTIGSVLGPT